jgi:hypothetical protein
MCLHYSSCCVKWLIRGPYVPRGFPSVGDGESGDVHFTVSVAKRVISLK